MFELGLGVPQSALQFLDLAAEVVGQGPGGVFLEVERVEEGLLLLDAEFVEQDAELLPASACERRSCSSSGHHEGWRSTGVSAPTRAASMKSTPSATS
ncbi:hypothetical protein AB0F92_42565 [Kitasatospora aureofaciens]|uniref:hypothetical protein n=1 Tax=Kitasatospora aureofaciens TaxID=1894 RepID=UPI0034047B1F